MSCRSLRMAPSSLITPIFVVSSFPSTLVYTFFYLGCLWTSISLSLVNIFSPTLHVQIPLILQGLSKAPLPNMSPIFIWYHSQLSANIPSLEKSSLFWFISL
jgi:hypothetical protein